MLLSLRYHILGGVGDKTETAIFRWRLHTDGYRVWSRQSSLQSLAQVNRSTSISKETSIHALNVAVVLIELEMS